MIKDFIFISYQLSSDSEVFYNYPQQEYIPNKLLLYSSNEKYQQSLLIYLICISYQTYQKNHLTY